MGGGKSSGNSTTTVQQSPEQAAALRAQTNFLTKTAFPAYASTIGGANTVYKNASGATTNAANTAMDVGAQTGSLNQGLGTSNSVTGSQGLQALFDPQYERNQVQAALQAGRESARESQAGQNAMYGGSGGLGSSRMALADANLASLNSQRQATAAAGAQAQVQANKASAAQSLLGAGANQLGAANQSAASRISYAQSPQDLYSKYASVVFGVPQGNTTPNFAGTQGSTQSGGSASKGFKL